MGISEQIKGLRQALGLTQSEFAQAAGISFPAVQLLESPRANPEWATLVAISRAFGVEFQMSEVAIPWNALLTCGVPLTESPSPTKNGAQPTAELLKTSLDRLALYIHFKGLASLKERELEALRAFLSAIKSHFPTWYKKKCKSKIWSQFKLNSLSSKEIKIRRICIERLSRYL